MNILFSLDMPRRTNFGVRGTLLMSNDGGGASEWNGSPCLLGRPLDIIMQILCRVSSRLC